MKKTITVIFLFSFLFALYGMQNKKCDVGYYGTIISIEQEMNMCSKLPIITMNKNNYYTHLQKYAQTYSKKNAIATYGLSACEPIEQACTMHHILYFVYNNPALYSCIQFIVKTKEELQSSKQELLAAIRLADMQIKSIY